MGEDLVSTGLNQLDAFLGGGLPAGSTILLTAPTGAGAEIFAKQFAAGTRSAADHVNIFVSTDESESDVRRAIEFFGFPGRPRIYSMADVFYSRVLEMERNGHALVSEAVTTMGRRWLTVQRMVGQGGETVPTVGDLAAEAGGGGEPPQDDGHDDLRRALFQSSATPWGASGANGSGGARMKDGKPTGRFSVAEMAAELHHGLFQPYNEEVKPSRYTVQSLDFFTSFLGPDRILETAIALKTANDRCRGLQLLVMTKGAMDPLIERRVETIADCLIELEFARKATQLEKYFVVKNVKNRYMGVGVTPYQVTRRGFQLDDLNRIL